MYVDSGQKIWSGEVSQLVTFSPDGRIEAVNTVEPILTLGAHFPRGGPAQAPVLTDAPSQLPAADQTKTLCFMPEDTRPEWMSALVQTSLYDKYSGSMEISSVYTPGSC